MTHWHGTVEQFATVDCSAMAAWLQSIPFKKWPQQSPAPDGSLRPAMVTDWNWHRFGEHAKPIVEALGFNRTSQWMLSAVMPGQEIPPHVDEQPSDWLYRVHVPILSNPQAIFRCGGQDHVLLPGIAYKVNTRAEHAVYNRGSTPRVHLMFDSMETKHG